MTAYAEFQLLPPSFTVQNVFALPEHDLGPAKEPLTQVADRQLFWDLGTDEVLSRCANEIQEGYETITEQEIDRVYLVDFGTAEWVLDVLGGVNIENEAERITGANVFAWLSRSVSNVDRHDEVALANRKSSLGILIKKLAIKAVLRPWKWKSLSYGLADRVVAGHIYVDGLTKDYSSANRFGLIEWNLGGAKSSRYLEKELRISLREVAPNSWNAEVTVQVVHLGGIDEPLSQEWKGVFEVLFPDFLEENIAQLPVVLPPGDTFVRTFSFFDIQSVPTKVAFFAPRSQSYFAHASLVVYPQQQLQSPDFNVRENTGVLRTVIDSGGYTYSWSREGDSLPPFLTLHTPVANKDEKSFVVEIHANEDVLLADGFYAELLDRNVVSDTTSNGYLIGVQKPSDDRTFWLTFAVQERQPNERYSLQISGLTDVWGNELSSGRRTVIDSIFTP